MQFVQNGVNGKNRYVVKGNKVYDSVNGQHLYTIDNGVMRSAITGAILTNGPVFVSDGENVDLSFVTATAGDILSGKVGADADGKPVNGSIETVTPTLAGNKFTVGKGYVAEAKELTVPESQITETSEKVTVGVGYINEQKEFAIQSGGGGSSGGWEIYRIKSYIPAESIVQSYSFNLTESGYYADEINGVYVRKTKEGFFDRYVNEEKGKVLLAICYIPDKFVEYSESLTDIRTKKWIIIDVKDSDSYTSEDIDTTNLKYSQSEGWSDNAVSVAYWWCRAEGTGRFDPFYPANSNYPISVNEWVPETIIGNKVVGYSGDTPSVENTDVELSGFQYSVEVGKSYVVHDGYVIGHPCFMPDLRITLKMSGMDDYDANANGIYTQNDFNKASQTSTWSNANGYVIKYDYMNSQWGCFATNGNVVANGGYGDSPLGATWYEMVNWSGTEVTLELYG